MMDVYMHVMDIFLSGSGYGYVYTIPVNKFKSIARDQFQVVSRNNVGLQYVDRGPASPP